MENNSNRNYDRDENNYRIENDQDREDQKIGQQAEEFTSDQPNRYSDQDRNINAPDTDDENRSTDQNRHKEDDRYYNEDEYRRNPLRRDRDQ